MKKKERKEKKGGKGKKAIIEKYWLPGLIILILSTALILFFLKGQLFSQLSEKEACRQSVILRSNLIARGLELVPLQCKTIQLEIKDTDEEKIKQKIANAMYDCWDMLGEGKIDFTGTLLREGPVRRCIICSKITFDDSVKKKLAGKEIEIYDYLLTTIIPVKNITYAQYLLGTESPGIQIKSEAPKINPSLDYVVIYQEIKGVGKDETVGQSIADVFTGMTTGAVAGGVIGAIGGALIGASVAGLATLYDFIASMIKGCIEERCPGIFLVPYTSEGIEKTCERIESIP
ncbi:MAG: hypothetical protein QW622_02370 [Candidatus Pacearchaeota archaeon]